MNVCEILRKIRNKPKMVNLKSVILIHLGPIYNCLVSQKTYFLVWLWPSKKINVFLYYFILCQPLACI